MNTRTRGRIIGAATIIAWLVALADAVLPDAWIDLTESWSVLVATAAATGSLMLAGWARARPATEVYELGFDAGRRQAKVDAAANRVRDGVVVPFKRNGTGG